MYMNNCICSISVIKKTSVVQTTQLAVCDMLLTMHVSHARITGMHVHKIDMIMYVQYSGLYFWLLHPYMHEMISYLYVMQKNFPCKSYVHMHNN